MQKKKTERANIEKQTGILGNFFLFGLAISIGLMVIAFQWKSYETIEKKPENIVEVPEDAEIPEVTQQKEKQPKMDVPTEVEVIKNDEPIKKDRPDIPIAETIDKGSIHVPKDRGETTKQEDEIFKSVQKRPSFPGGKDARQRFVLKNMNYPRQAKEVGIEGTVFVNFVVNKDGSISKVTVKSGVNKALNEEAKQVVKAMPNWNPGKQRGKKVRATVLLPIQFSLGG